MIIKQAIKSVANLRNINTNVQSYGKLVDVHPLIQRSLQKGEPVVALESTIITHGMPHPHNLETAQEVEEIVRKNGATPATIALIDGRIKVGLTQSDLVKLSSKKQNDAIKCSRRDLPYLVARGQTGGTTVAATMIIANMIGIKIFATGGVGGVHRDGHITLDVSADLIELGKTPVAVVCSGVKSILDIPRTLEFLETQGVCVATYGSANGNFPDFYTRDSGYKVPYNLKDPSEAARLIEALQELKLQSGILIGVPVPEEFAADKKLIELAINKAYIEMQTQGITGKHVTPFLLAAISNITKGKSLQANIALIKNNASVAAQIAQEFSRSECFSLVSKANQKQSPLVIGGSILDLSLTMTDEMPKTFEGASFNSKTKQSAGGVGRNLAEGIYKLYGKANFISAIGNDQLGKCLLQLIPKPLQEGVQIDPKNATSLCSLIFDNMGDCKLILGNMDIHHNIRPDQIKRHEEWLRTAPLIIMDSNLSIETMECILKLALQHQRPVFFEPTDMRIAGRPFQSDLLKHLTKQIKFISPNIYELKNIVESITKKTFPWPVSTTVSTELLLDKTTEMMKIIENHFDCILVTLGHHGIVLSCRQEHNKPLFNPKHCEYLRPSDINAHSLRFYAAPVVNNVTNVSGAGDSFSSGFITGLLRGYEIAHSVAFGFMAAEKALQTESAVPNKYFANEKEELTIFESTLQHLKLSKAV